MFYQRHRLANPLPEKRKYPRKSQLWSEDFTAKLVCNVEFWMERPPKLIEPQPIRAVGCGGVKHFQHFQNMVRNALDGRISLWEFSPMTTVAKADKSRLTIRGLVDGRHYIVHEQPGGWFITPEKAHRIKRAGMSADAFARLYGSRAPLGADTAKEISANLAATDKAK
ncbi:MAG: hypothetical protein ABSG04_10435 [Verrucomicrobiota bacterium]